VTDESPWSCKTYFNARDILSPHLQPYYDTYAASYIDTAKPYVTPAVNFANEKYYIHGAPLVEKGVSYGQDQWEKAVQPQILSAASGAKQQYDTLLAPHVDRVNAAAQPYYGMAKENLLQTYYTHLLPTYTATRPYAEHAYAIGSDFAVQTGIPYTHWASSTVAGFVNRTIWPRVRVLYGENVEPQLVRIVERLGRYRDSKKLKAAVKDVDESSISLSKLSSISSVAAGHAKDSKTKATTTASKSLTPQQQEAEARKEIAADLKKWQDKFATAATKGREDLEERVQDITHRQIKSQVDGVGAALNVELEETIKDEISALKTKIVSMVRSLSKESIAADAQNAQRDVSTAVREAGVSIKTKAQALRAWKHNFNDETFALIEAASNSTLEVVDNIRDLGLQEIGTKWAWMEGVTYKDWAEYHTLKKSFEDKRDQVEDVAKNPKVLTQIQEAGDEIESKGMSVATEAAMELKRLKDAGIWKINAGDSSDDFSTKHAPAAAVKAGQEILEKVAGASEAIVGTSQGTMGSVISQASTSAADVVSSASSMIVGKQPGKIEEAASRASGAILGTETPSVESIASKASSGVEDIKNAASSAVIQPIEQVVGKANEAAAGDQQPIAESVISAASEKAKDAASDAGSVVGTPPPHGSATSKISESISSVISAASEALPATESIESVRSSIVDSASSTTSSIAFKASKKVWGGASAQFVDAREIVYEDVIEEDDSAFSLKIQSMASQAGDRYSEITNAVSEALVPTSTQGNVESITSLASAQYADALLAASRALYGTEQGTGESLVSVASGKYAQAVAA
jgi:hypothetical protein